mgnify:CR=1 FL=1
MKSPLNLDTGKLSPVTIDSSIIASSDKIIPSVGIISPGLTISISFILRLFIFTSSFFLIFYTSKGENLNVEEILNKIGCTKSKPITKKITFRKKEKGEIENNTEAMQQAYEFGKNA